MAIQVCSEFLIASVQDLGRKGYAAYGFRQCGACDKYAMRLANILCGNVADENELADKQSYAAGQRPTVMEGMGNENSAVIEISLLGASFLFTEDTLFALTGADMSPELDGKTVAMYQGVCAKAGQVLKLSPATEGCRTYLAVYGGIQVPLVLGSRSTDAACGIGGYEGRNLKKGDLLPTIDGKKVLKKTGFAAETGTVKELSLADAWWLKKTAPSMRSVDGQLISVLRVVAGPQDERFTAQGLETLWRNTYQITANSNRMAYRLEGKPLETMHGSDIISDAIVEGSVQVAADGMPIVMLADHQTTGGYAKIGTVIRPDLCVLAQKKPGERIGFLYVTPEEAAVLYKKEEEKLRGLREVLRSRFEDIDDKK